MQVEGLLQTPDDLVHPGRMHSEGVVQASISGVGRDAQGRIISSYTTLLALCWEPHWSDDMEARLICRQMGFRGECA